MLQTPVLVGYGINLLAPTWISEWQHYQQGRRDIRLGLQMPKLYTKKASETTFNW